MDTSFYQRPGTAPVVDIGGAATKGLSLRKLMTDVQFQPQLLQQQLDTARVGQLATEEATRKAVQEREEQARKIAAQKDIAALYKEKLAAKPVDGTTGKKTIGDDIHREVYESALMRGHDVATLSDLRDRAQTIRASDLTDTESRHTAKNKLFRQLDMEVAKSRSPQETTGLVTTKIKEMTKLGMTPEEAQTELSNRYGTSIEQTPVFAQRRLEAEMTPLKSAELALAQAANARAAAQQQVDVGAGAAAGQAAIGDIDTALAGLGKLKGTHGTKIGSWISANYDQYVTQTAEGGALARAVAAYNARNPGQVLDVKAMGYEPVRAALEGERKSLATRVKATAPVLGAGATVPPPAVTPPPAGPTTETPVGEYTYWNNKQNKAIKIKKGPDSDKSTWKILR